MDQESAEGALKEKRRLVKTTVGRALLSELLPRGLPFELVNQDMTKKRVQAVINSCYRALGLKETVIFADRLMYTGFSYATRCGDLDRRGRHDGPAAEAEDPRHRRARK